MPPTPRGLGQHIWKVVVLVFFIVVVTKKGSRISERLTSGRPSTCVDLVRGWIVEAFETFGLKPLPQFAIDWFVARKDVEQNRRKSKNSYND